MGLFLKLQTSDTVHDCANCSHVKRIMAGAVSRFDVRKDRKKWRRTESCNECKSKRRRGVCEAL